ncbi:MULTISPECIES: hypothetical protein [Streptacidiphilus]|uniref:Lipoprotein n=2 Tax=Streptacidiphilus TaxID=228398 RepID=A0ABV6UQ48_9ACTN|nr:hypothetical protein [Streptacidiphilus jeojiense]
MTRLVCTASVLALGLSLLTLAGCGSPVPAHTMAAGARTCLTLPVALPPAHRPTDWAQRPARRRAPRPRPSLTTPPTHPVRQPAPVAPLLPAPLLP